MSGDFEGTGPINASPYSLALWSFNNAWAVATEKSAASDAGFEQAQSAAHAPTIVPAGLPFTVGVVEPPVDIPSHADGVSQAQFEQLSRATTEYLAGLFAGYLQAHFPNETALLTAGETWLVNAITAGGTGIRPEIEDQIWQRDRARVLSEADRLEDELVSSWAAKGYDFLPGEMMYRAQQLHKEAADRNAQASRDIAIKQAELEVSNVRFAVEKALTQYSTALAAASNYIKELSVGSSVAAQISVTTTDAQAKLISASSSFYQSRIAVEELRLKALATAQGWDQETRVKNAELTMAEVHSRVDAAVAGAQSVGTQAAAALNALHVGASVSAGTSNGVSYHYSNDTESTAPVVTFIG